MTYPVAASRDIAAPAEKVWALVSDLPRMGEFSPENQGGTWTKGSTGPAVGAIFTGKNKKGVRRWATTVTVTECRPGQLFEIAVAFGPFAIANWRYEFQDTAGGCRVTESWDDLRKGWMKVASRPMGDHGPFNAQTQMAATLANLAQATEG
jgi:ligand-binding SRPBCC domain-containing protein